MLNLLAAAAENPQTISNFCTFVQYLITSPRQEAGFIGVDEIRMFLEKIFTLIWHFNFFTHIILVFKFIKGILFLFDLDGETRGKNNAL